jgi:hypothetical protein
MPKVMGVQLSGGALAVRLATAVVGAAVSFLLLYYLPANISTVVPQGASALASPLFPPVLPPLGLAITALVFLGFLLRGTGAYGFILLLLGLLFIAYVYILFGGGTIYLQIPSSAAYGASGTVAVNASTLMYILLVAPILTVVKGVFILTTHREARAAEVVG